ncbi:hypothetical protein [Photobacterium leiognathi]|uniref:hypothetical protein n=1 Tax=Photobacterium leiognathi TaxID=553611 RepID=UPI00298225A6|nr:hypothetical protein [Photobacterium leiognathi]
MNKNWLVDRLTPSRKEAGIWRDFAYALQDLLNTHVEEYLTRLRRKLSLFDADKRDLDQMLKELGTVFALGNVNDDNLPLVVMQRQDEIHQKKTIYPLVNTLVREFNGIKVSWEPLYAPIDQDTYPYGTKFVIQSEIKDEAIPESDWFMTSRGVIRVPMLEVNRAFGDEISTTDEAIDKFESLIRDVIYPLIPLRIVCDGQQYFLNFDLTELPEYMAYQTSAITSVIKDMIERVEGADSKQSITTSTNFTNERESDPFPCQNRLDAFRCDALRIDKAY